MVRSLQFTHLSWIYHMLIDRNRGAHETRLSPDAHGVAPRAPCRTRARQLHLSLSLRLRANSLAHSRDFAQYDRKVETALT